MSRSKLHVGKQSAITILTKTTSNDNMLKGNLFPSQCRNLIPPSAAFSSKAGESSKTQEIYEDHNYSKKPLTPRYKTARNTFELRRNRIPSSQCQTNGRPNDSINEITLWRYLHLKAIEFARFTLWLILRLFKNKKYFFVLLPLLTFFLSGSLSNDLVNKQLQTFLSNTTLLFFHSYKKLPKAFQISDQISLESIGEEISCTEKLLIVLQFMWLTLFNLITNFTSKVFTEISGISIFAKASAVFASSVQLLAIKLFSRREDVAVAIANEAMAIANESLILLNKILEGKINSSFESLIAAKLKYEMRNQENNKEFVQNTSNQILEDWLQFKLLDYPNINSKKKSEENELKQKRTIQKTVERTVKHYLKQLGTNSTVFNDKFLQNDKCSSNLIRKLVQEAIMTYDADKTGLVDYALESAGGSVVSTRSSESYFEKGNQFRVFNIPLWTSYNSPRKSIQPSMQPGQCWAFKGNQGFLVVKLAYPIYPTGFSVEHIPVSLSPSGSIDSAPKNFSVWGLLSENDEGKILGTYLYDLKGHPLQYFPAQTTHNMPFFLVELKIHSNHGNPEFTCLYRFRVHGNRENKK